MMKLRTDARTGMIASGTLLVASVMFLLVWRLVNQGWLWFGGAPQYAVIPIQTIDLEVLRLAKKEGMFQVWIHNISPKQVVPFHSHYRRTEMVAILRGKARVKGLRKSTSGGEPIIREEILEAGNFVISPPTAVHQFENAGDEPLWCMVMMSPPFRGNNLLGNDPPVSERDFIVLPWEPVAAGTSARGEELPLWVTSLEAPWQGPIKSFARIPSRLLRGEGMFEATNPRVESWMMLVSGEGVLTIAGDTHYLKAPTWIYAPKAGWSLQSTEGEIVAFEFQVPAFDLGLFWQGLYDRFQHHFPGWLKYLLEDFVTA